MKLTFVDGCCQQAQPGTSPVKKLIERADGRAWVVATIRLCRKENGSSKREAACRTRIIQKTLSALLDLDAMEVIALHPGSRSEIHAVIDGVQSNGAIKLYLRFLTSDLGQEWQTVKYDLLELELPEPSEAIAA